MTRFAWLQTRTQTLAVVAAVGALAVVLAVTGVQLAHLYNQLVAPCQSSGNCDPAIGRFLSHDHFLQNALTLLMRVAPALIGIFWGAPLVARELETGTFRLAWTQSVTRPRWLVTKLALVAIATVLVAGALTLAVTWWNRGIDKISLQQYGDFDDRDIAPIAYALFAFALGAALGAVIRRTVPAMAATLAGFVFVRIAVQEWVRPHLLTPLHKVVSLSNVGGFGFFSSNGGPFDMVAKAPDIPNAWIQSSQLFTNAGHATTASQRAAFLHQYCPSILTPPPLPKGNGGIISRAGSDAAFQACHDQAARMFHLVVTYQPASHYWPLQWIESGIFVGLAAVAAAACYFWVTRRAT